MKAKILKGLRNPDLVIVFNKHHKREFYVLATKEIFVTHGMTRGSEIRRVGPAIIQIDQIGVRREIVKHSINGKSFWKMLEEFVKVGAWALNNRIVAPLLPNDFLAISNRFRGMGSEQRIRMKKSTNATLRKHKVVRVR